MQVFTVIILCIKLCCMLTSKRNVRLTVLHTSVTDSRLNWTVWQMRQVMLCTVHTAVGLAFFLVMQWPLNLLCMWVW
jgi:hypothetical protein